MVCGSSELVIVHYGCFLFFAAISCLLCFGAELTPPIHVHVDDDVPCMFHAQLHVGEKKGKGKGKKKKKKSKTWKNKKQKR